MTNSLRPWSGCRLAAALVVCSGLSMAASGRIGATLEECTVQYGTPLETTVDQARFAKNDFEAVIHFYQLKADSIIFTGKAGQSLSKQQIEELLQANGAGKSWVAYGATTRLGKAWITEDRTLFAILESSQGYLTIKSREAVERISPPRKVENSAQLRSF